MDVAQHVEDRSPRGIAAAVSRLVRSGDLRPGDRLPTVRRLAADLGVSPATVSGAWQALAAVGLVASRGRAGTVVLPEPASWLPPRYRDLAAGGRSAGGTEPGGTARPLPGAATGTPGRSPVAAAPATRPGRPLDLSTGTPDPALLPPLGRALARVAAATPAAGTGSYLGAPVVEPLERLLRTSWPFTPQRVTVVDGAVDAMSRTLEQLAGFGDRVVVEDPSFPPIFDLCDQLGLERVPVPLDRQGLRPDALAAALRTGAEVVVLQPRAHNPTGVSMTSTRARELAAVVRKHLAQTPGAGLTIVEDDHSGEIASSADVSLGSHLPDRVVHVRSYSKSHGPDLRIAAVGGPAAVLDRVVARRMLGPGWTSRLLQHVLADLLDDGEALAAVAQARRTYYARQRALSTALAGHGVEVQPGDGINLWVPVADEATALVRLAAAGIRVAPGRPFRAGSGPDDGPDADADPPAGGAGHVRVTVGALSGGPDEVQRVATALSLAALP
ncbi:aminotransferase-like domain-containing protein [Cellulomonas pakistanensis]|uniref:GntR family transcriptional regulator n=1 Tax=Cellulomonas pakistanensis TaxID=992287 RepID=A0A919PB26_9CELL|nr:aminotransferase class I/II-fold pyridoxal phosphate-dependent enzyme [Cellulomonas pakistanensis]GIG36898.1 GntR family transcriptional regulator [Cellulomonas pakistanensis]